VEKSPILSTRKPLLFEYEQSKYNAGQGEAVVKRRMRRPSSYEETGTWAMADSASLKPSPCSACGGGLDRDSDYDEACDIGAREMLCEDARRKCKCQGNCSVHSEELEFLRRAIKENNVQFQRCRCKIPKWAMNWRRRDLYKNQHFKWGAFQKVCNILVGKNFRGKEQVSRKN
jgi:hypothetical protein